MLSCGFAGWAGVVVVDVGSGEGEISAAAFAMDTPPKSSIEVTVSVEIRRFTVDPFYR
jgi:hypothetical protein